MGPLLVGVGFIVAVVATIFLFRFLIKNATQKLVDEGAPAQERSALTKKFYDVDIHRYSTLFVLIGLAFSLGIVLTAFEWKTYDEGELVNLGTLEAEQEEVIDVPIVELPPPPPPKQVIKQPKIVEVPDEEEIEQEIEVELDVEVEEEAIIEEVVEVEEVEEEEEVEQIFTVVEDPAQPKGGYPAFYKYIKKKMKYPKQARRMGVEGKVYVQFIVDQSGNITNIKIMKGIGAGCDEEAKRVIREAPKWKPGKQRGRPVKQKIVVPIVFKLG